MSCPSTACLINVHPGIYSLPSPHGVTWSYELGGICSPMVTSFLTQWNSSDRGAFSSFLILSYRLWKIYVYEVCSVLLSCDIVLTAQMKFQVWHYQTEYALEKLFFWVFYFTLCLILKMQNRPQEMRRKLKLWFGTEPQHMLMWKQLCSQNLPVLKIQVIHYNIDLSLMGVFTFFCYQIKFA